MNRAKTQIDLYVIERVRKRRKLLGLSQENLSDIVGYSSTFIGERESGVKKYNLIHLNRLAIALQCSIKDFLPDVPFPDPKVLK